ncbi:MAG: hypothetical protein JO027_12285 [Solirubrobacterales bacterium]|nr:hypothetical protein [Solirubrobacterales bacterium]
MLESFGVSYPQVRGEVVRMMGVGLEEPEGEIGLTGRAQDVIDRARREASLRDQRLVGTEHILLALVHDRDGAAARILIQLDADPVAIRQALGAD